MPFRISAGLLGVFAILAFSAAGPVPARAQQGADDKLVADVEGEKIFDSDIVAAFGTLPPATRKAGLAAVYPDIRERLIQQLVILKRGQEAGLEDDPVVQQRLAITRGRIVHDLYLERRIKDRISETDLQKAYLEWLEENPPKTEVRARHILVATEAEAKAIIDRIAAGEVFADLARELSTGPSASQGGDLGYFTKDRMVKPFADVAFALQANQYSSNPVQTQYGWHVIMVEDRREAVSPTFEQMRPDLIRRAADQIAEQVTRELVEAATITRYGQPGEPVQ